MHSAISKKAQSILSLTINYVPAAFQERDTGASKLHIVFVFGKKAGLSVTVMLSRITGIVLLPTSFMLTLMRAFWRELVHETGSQFFNEFLSTGCCPVLLLSLRKLRYLDKAGNTNSLGMV
jgi:hypothetical protein